MTKPNSAAENRAELSSAHDTHLCVVRAESEFELGRFQDAALSYLSVTISDPDNSDAYYNLALCLERCGRWDVASEAFQHVLRLDAGRTDARLGLGACLLHLNRAEEALVHFDRGCVGTDSGPALFGKAAALQLLGRFDDARRIYEAFLASNPNSAEALSNCVALSIEIRDLERVWDYSQRLLKICPRSTVALQGLATSAFGGSDYPSAVSYCDRILELAPDCLEAWHNFRIAMDHSTFRSIELNFAVHIGGKQ